jgi:hypothetical protein
VAQKQLLTNTNIYRDGSRYLVIPITRIIHSTNGILTISIPLKCLGTVQRENVTCQHSTLAPRYIYCHLMLVDLNVDPCVFLISGQRTSTGEREGEDDDDSL